jgi:hypothetical protein
MVSMVILVVIVLGTYGIVWMRWCRRHAYAIPVSPEAPRETLGDFLKSISASARSVPTRRGSQW